MDRLPDPRRMAAPADAALLRDPRPASPKAPAGAGPGRRAPLATPKRRKRPPYSTTELPGYGALETASGVATLAGQTFRAMVRRPFVWRRDALEQSVAVLKLCLSPLILAMLAFALGAIVSLIGGALLAIGTVDRLGGGFAAALVREVGFWVTSMIFAGVVGSAVTADLGARKIREELDALAVLGVDQVRTLVVPRVVSLTIMAPVLGLLALGATLGVVAVSAPLLVPNLSTSGVLSIASVFATVGDLISLVLKLVLCGLIVGFVACYKGLYASGGTEGVGKAVNQAVLINFLALWTLNTLWNMTFLAVFPGIQVLRG